MAGRSWLWAAAAAGGVHAAFNLFWALGGDWLLPTVGQWAVRLVAERPVRAGLALGVVALVKALGAALPLVWAAGRLPLRRAWTWAFGMGATVLIAYGGLNVAVSWGVLTGVVPSPGGFDRRAQIGHAALWDPLFLGWGIALAIGLHRTARNRFVSSADGH